MAKEKETKTISIPKKEAMEDCSWTKKKAVCGSVRLCLACVCESEGGSGREMEKKGKWRPSSRQIKRRRRRKTSVDGSPNSIPGLFEAVKEF